MFIFADTTNNIYKIHPKDHEKPNKISTTKMHKKAPTKLEKSINLEAKNIADNINVEDCTENLPRAELFITLNITKTTLPTIQHAA